MNNFEFLGFNQVNSQDLMAVVNEDALRTHLVAHPYFDAVKLHAWMKDKMNTDAMPGCRIRAVYIDGVLAGWCGIQPDDNGFELAIVISQKFWGSGITIFKTLMCWAKELGHKEVLFHLLESRPKYKALDKISTKVTKTALAGRCFTTYYITVGG